MKKLCLALALLTCVGANAQINVGSKEVPGNKAGSLSEDDMNDLKKTTTLFTLQQKDYAHQEDFEKAIAEVWKVTKFKIIRPEEVKKYELQEGYSFFTMGGFYTQHAGSNHMTTYTLHMSYDLSIPEVGKKGKVTDHQYFTRMILALDANGMRRSISGFSRSSDDRLKTFMYKEAHFDNWGAGFLKGQLTTINGALMAGETRELGFEEEQDELLAALKTDTLYVPDYVNERFSALTGGDHEGDKDESSLRESYSYPLKMVKAEEINSMIMNSTKPFYYLVFVRAQHDKYINVYRSDKGIIYARYQNQSFNFKYKDLSRIEKAVK
jgi:hypothetical protein